MQEVHYPLIIILIVEFRDYIMLTGTVRSAGLTVGIRLHLLHVGLR